MIPSDNPRILLVNDDGIHAPGMAILESIARELSDDVWIVAPEQEQSAASRGVTLHTPLRLRKLAERKYAVAGTPTDCVILALLDVLEDNPPDLVLSGVNRGQNIAEDITFSGTIAGALQGMQMGIPAIALSQALGFRKGENIPWETAARHAPGLIRTVLKAGWPGDVMININFPDVLPDDVTGVEITHQGRRDKQMQSIDKRTDPRGRTYYWLSYGGGLSNPPEGTDLRAIYDGRISITPLHPDLSHGESLEALAKALK